MLSKGTSETLRSLATAVAAVALLMPIPAYCQAGAQPSREGAMAASQAPSKLLETAFQPLPLGAIRPTGWLLSQLRIQADGLSGHLDEFWPDIKDSGWMGGKAEGWERAPYWLDGLVPLAYSLDDEALKSKVARWMDYILTHQDADGWLGPVATARYQSYDPWPRFVMLKAMTQYYEATRDPRVMPVMEKFLHRLDALLAEKPLFEWGQYRWMDLVISIHWLYDRTREPWLLELADKAHAQGFNWRGHFADFKYHDRVTQDFKLETHVVNNAMSVKAGGVWYRQSRDTGDRGGVYRAMEMLDQYHGQVTGIFAGDEHYAGKSPSQGSELCSVVEYMFSLETLLAILGDPALGDRLERIGFNALPATFKPDMWAHQYDQQVNQVLCRIDKDRVFASNGADANIFGLEPNYGCCTANFSQGWPKLTSHLWMASPDSGLVAVAYAPCTVTAEIAGHPVKVAVETDYPFNDTVKIAVEAEGKLPLRLRIPAWAEGAQVSVGDEAPAAARAGTFHCITREWHGKTPVTLRFPMKARFERRYHNSVSMLRGPLVYSLKVGEEWKKVRGEEPHADWEVHPTTPWNYGLQIDEGSPDKCVTFETRPVGKCPFSPDDAPIKATAKGKLVPEWTLAHNAAGPLPDSPAASAEALTDLTLIPYGCAKLRVTEFPVLK